MRAGQHLALQSRLYRSVAFDPRQQFLLDGLVPVPQLCRLGCGHRGAFLLQVVELMLSLLILLA
jgi:hypothetical protein